MIFRIILKYVKYVFDKYLMILGGGGQDMCSKCDAYIEPVLTQLIFPDAARW